MQFIIWVVSLESSLIFLMKHNVRCHLSEGHSVQGPHSLQFHLFNGVLPLRGDLKNIHSRLNVPKMCCGSSAIHFCPIGGFYLTVRWIIGPGLVNVVESTDPNSFIVWFDGTAMSITLALEFLSWLSWCFFTLSRNLVNLYNSFPFLQS